MMSRPTALAPAANRPLINSRRSGSEILAVPTEIPKTTGSYDPGQRRARPSQVTMRAQLPAARRSGGHRPARWSLRDGCASMDWLAKLARNIRGVYAKLPIAPYQRLGTPPFSLVQA